jgi:hypothetical protein
MMVSGKKILSLAMVVVPMAFMSTLTGCLTDDKKTDPVATDSLMSDEVTLGAQSNNSLGSFLDLDNYEVLKQSAAEAASADVDLIFAYSGTANAAAIYSPDAAKAGIAGGAGLAIAQGLTTANKVEIRTIGADKFAAAKTAADLQAAYDAGIAAADGRLLLSNGVAFAAKSSKGVLVGMLVSGLTASTDGQVTLTGITKK